MAEGRLLDKMVKARNAIGRQSATVKIGDEDVELFWEPITVADTKAVESLHPETEFDHNLCMIGRKITDANGNRLFKDGDKYRLETEVEVSLVAAIVRAMTKDIPKTIEEATEELEKNRDS